MWFMRSFSHVATIAALLSGFAAGAAADEDWFPEIPDPPIVLVIDGAFDDAGGRDYQAALDLPFLGGYTASLMLGRAHIDLQSDSLDFVYGSAGIRYQYKGLGAGIEVGVWGDSDLLDTRDYTGRISYQWERWRVDLKAVYRAIDFGINNLRSPITDQLISFSAKITDRAWGGGLAFYPTRHWGFYLDGEQHHYDAALRSQQFAQALRRLSLTGLDARRLTTVLRRQAVSTLEESSGFPRWSWSGGVDYAFSDSRVNIEYSVTQSVFDRQRSNSLSAAYQFPLGRSQSYYLDLRLGREEPNLFPGSLFGGVSLLMFF